MQQGRTDAELERRARARYEAMALRARTDLGLYIEMTTPKYRRPAHLQPVLDLVDEAMRRPVFATLSVPPRHFKTETLLHALVRMMKVHPDRMNAYATYSSQFASRKSRKARDIARRANVPLRYTHGAHGADPAATVGYWQTTFGGGLLAVGRGGGFTGDGVTGLLVVDDPHKDRKDAESVVSRDDVWDWFTDVALTRVEAGASVFVVHTRWHEDDLIGRIQSSGEFGDWHHINLPALAEESGDLLGRAPGQALMPERYPAAHLGKLRRRIGEYSFASLYQGMPRPRGGALFGPPTYYTKLPDTALQLAYGIDMAYTKRTSSDWSVIVWMAKAMNDYFQPVYYVLHVDRVQVKSPQFGALVKARLEHHWSNVFWRAVGPEIGSADMMAEHLGVPISFLPTRGDKFIHAQPFAAAWNDGRVRLPVEATSWKADYIKELSRFTGVNDAEDDQVDASCNAFDGLTGAAVDFDAAYDAMLPQARV